MTRTEIGLAAALLLLVTACSASGQEAQPSTTPILPPNTAVASSTTPSTAQLDQTPRTLPAASSTAGSETHVPHPPEFSTTPTAPPSPPTDSLSFDPARSEGSFTISIADSIHGQDRENAERAAALVRDAIVLKDFLAQNMDDISHDSLLDSYFVGQGLAQVKSSLERGRSTGLTQEGWVGGTITVKSSANEVSSLTVCHDMTNIQISDAAGVPFPRVAGQVGTYSVAPYEQGPRISTLEYDQTELVTCTP